jgi:hypothetical protein
MNQNKKVTSDDINQFISSADSNQDRKISKEELYQIFTKVVSGTKAKN